MDPDEAPRQLRAAVETYHATVDQDGRDAGRDAAAWAIAERADALDGWLSRCGCLPADWARSAELTTADEPR